MSLRYLSTLTQNKLARGAMVAISVFGAIATSGCGTFNRLPDAPAKVSSEEQIYKIGAMDTLNIVVWRNPDLSSNITVRPDGRISLPLVEDLQAAGRTPADLARDIEKALAKFIREPVVTVVVNNFQGISTEQIRIVGEATRPQSVPFRKGQTALDVMLIAGGLTDFADGNGAVLIRGAESGKQYRVRLKDLLKRGDISANIELLPGDIIIVPQSWF